MKLAVVMAALAGLAGCFVSFEDDGRPCDPANGCLAGYTCDASHHCRASKGAGATASSSAGSTTASSSGSGSASGSGATNGSGSTSGSGATGGTSAGSTGSGSTGGDACASVDCPLNQQCEVVSGVPGCVGRAANTCATATNCPVGSVCLLPPSGAGVCSTPCAADGGCAAGLSCTSLPGARGNPIEACLPAPAPSPCTPSTGCGGGLACVPIHAANNGATATFDQAFPVLMCDRAPGATGTGLPCQKNTDCASGLCEAVSYDANGAGGAGQCADTCTSTADCGGDPCVVVADIERGEHLMGCLKAARTACADCAIAPACGADAPTCSTLTGCVLTCSGSAANKPCGPTGTCITMVGTAESYCGPACQ